MPPERIPFPKIEVVPVVDRVIEAALWVGHLITQRHGHEGLSDHSFEVHPPEPSTLNRWDSEGTYFDGQ